MNYTLYPSFYCEGSPVILPGHQGYPVILAQTTSNILYFIPPVYCSLESCCILGFQISVFISIKYYKGTQKSKFQVTAGSFN